MRSLQCRVHLAVTVAAGLLATALAPVITLSCVFAQGATALDTTLLPRGMVRVTWARSLRTLQRGDTLRAEDFVLSDTVIQWKWTAAPESKAQVGWLVKRAFASGEFMREPAVSPLPVITAGSTVKVMYQEGGVRLTLSGVATNNAALGAPVGVRIDRNRRLDGFAVGPNSVRLR